MGAQGSFIASFLRRSDTGTGRTPQQDYGVVDAVALATRSRTSRLRREARDFKRSWFRQLILMIVLPLGMLGTSLLFVLNPFMFISLLILVPVSFVTCLRNFMYRRRQYWRWVDEQALQTQRAVRSKTPV